MTNQQQLNGIDISENQTVTDFEQTFSGLDFVIVRASFGNAHDDVKAYGFRQQVRQQQKLLAHYHYAKPLESSGPEQARIFLDACGIRPEGEPLLLDVEEDMAGLEWWSQMFCTALLAITGKPPLMYLNPDFLSRYDWSGVASLGCGLWLADWDGQQDSSRNVSPFAFTALKQWTDNFGQAGFAAAVDGDVFYGNGDQFRAYGP